METVPMNIFKHPLFWVLGVLARIFVFAALVAKERSAPHASWVEPTRQSDQLPKADGKSKRDERQPGHYFNQNPDAPSDNKEKPAGTAPGHQPEAVSLLMVPLSHGGSSRGGRIN